MADEKNIIIIKKKKGGAHGHHGGAWKVAYADFVTAMMAFFMVMWLLGSDDETRAAVSRYFNNPTSAWRRDLTSKDTLPLGDKTGAGENIMNGAEGSVPDDLIDKPVRPYNEQENQGKEANQVLEHLLSDENLVRLDELKFSIPENLLFKEGTTNEWASDAEKIVTRIGHLTQKYQGKLTIASVAPEGGYEFQVSRVVNVAKRLVENDWTTEDQIATEVSEGRRTPSSKSPRKLAFTLSRRE